MIKNIVFDMGGVLVEYNPEIFVKQLGYTDRKEIDYILNHIFLSPLWKDMDAGFVNADEGHKKMVDTIDEKYKKDAEYLVNNWWKMRKPIDGMFNLVKLLKEKGYKIYLLSNASDEHPRYWQQLPYKDYFDALYVSSFHKKLKPNREIYEEFINENKLIKEECLFIDDTKANVDAAIEYGLKGHIFVGADELKDYLKTINII